MSGTTPPRFLQIIAKSYSWTEVVVIRVVAPNFDLDPEKIDYIGDKQDNRITITVNGKKLLKHFSKLPKTAQNC